MPKRSYYRKIYQENKKKSPALFLRPLKWLFLVFLFFVFGSFFLFIIYAKDLPRPEKFAERELFQSTKIYDKSGEILLFEIFGEEKRTWVSLDEIPVHLKKAVIATEDANFKHHFGIDFRGIARAFLVNLKTGEFVHGGSTISQQLIRSTFLTPERVTERKIREIILTIEMERRYSKDQILEWYLNQVPFGRNTYGAGAASQAYFGKSVSDISITEAAILAALIRAPSYYSHEKNFNKLLARKNHVLRRMVSEGFLTKEEKELIQKEEINLVRAVNPIRAPHFVMYVRNYLVQKYGEDFLREEGLKIYTSLDWELQEWAEKIVSEKSKRNKKYRAHNSALVAMNPKTGEILAMVGSKNWFGESEPKGCLAGENCLFEPKPNVALRERQPGSAFKPFVYATAFKKGHSDQTLVTDEETNFGTLANPYIPQNYDGLFRGPVTLRQALAQSLNVPSVKVLRDLAGLEDSIKAAQEMGITTLTRPLSFYGLAIVLGGAEVQLLDMVSAYGVFATEGLKIPPVFILRIEDSQGKILEEDKKTPKRVLEPEIARLINDVLSDNQARAPIFGLNSVMYFENYKMAAKTGTTQNYKDGWIIGYPVEPARSSIVVGVWAGNNDNTPMRREPGVVVAGPIWRAFMEKALKSNEH